MFLLLCGCSLSFLVVFFFGLFLLGHDTISNIFHILLSTNLWDDRFVRRFYVVVVCCRVDNRLVLFYSLKLPMVMKTVPKNKNKTEKGISMFLSFFFVLNQKE